MNKIQATSGGQLSKRSILIWRIVQSLVWVIGVIILFNLVFFPIIGIHLFWNILIPVAPLLLVVAVGLWRNVCPMASTALFPRHMGLSKRKKLSIKQTGVLNIIGVIALFIIVPLRHAIFDTSGLATAILIISLGLIAVIAGSLYEWKSAWCSGLCPVHPVEKLYGLKNALALPNAHCDQCHRCTTPCPDSTPGINPVSTKKTKYHKRTGDFFVGAFPGFVWGWFQVPDYAGITGIDQLIFIYQMPLIGLLITGFAYLILKHVISEKLLVALFSAATVSCYYWFRIPGLLGYGNFPGDGMLFDLSGSIPEWSLTIAVTVLTLFFFWWIVFSKKNNMSWGIRPEYADNKNEASVNVLASE